jgi:ribosomal protein S27AE
LNMCKDCVRRRVARHRGQHLERIRAYDRDRPNKAVRLANATVRNRESRIREPQKYQAKNAVNNAVRDGKLTRPAACEQCGSTFALHGHHDDYSKPLEVRWLCAACHHQYHHTPKQQLLPLENPQ